MFNNVRTFLSINGGGYWSLTRTFDEVVLGAMSGYIGNLFDSVVSHTGQFLFSCRLVRYFFHSIPFSRSSRHLCHCSTQNEESTSQRMARSKPNTSKSFARVPSTRLEVTVHKAYEEHAMSHTNFSNSFPSTDGQLHDKPSEISFDDNTDDHVKT